MLDEEEDAELDDVLFKEQLDDCRCMATVP